MFVFGEVQDPTTETVNLVEDIVRGQIIELVRGLPLPLSRDINVCGTPTGYLFNTAFLSTSPLHDVPCRSFKPVI